MSPGTAFQTQPSEGHVRQSLSANSECGKGPSRVPRVQKAFARAISGGFDKNPWW